MMKTLQYTVLTALSLSLLAGCGTKPAVEEPTQTGVEVTASITNFTGESQNPSTFGSGDAIGLYVVNTPGQLSAVGNQVTNTRYTYNGSAWSAGMNSPKWKDATTPADLYAYSPFVTSIQSVEAVPFAVKANQSTARSGSTPSAYESSDFLWVKAAGVAPGTKQPLAFKHALSKVVVTVAAGSSISQGEFAGLAKSVSIENLNLGATVNLKTGVATTAAAGSITSITPYKEGDVTFKAIVVPQSVAAGTDWVTIRVGDSDFRYNTATTLQPGMQYNITVSANIENQMIVLRLETSSVTAWTVDSFIHTGFADYAGATGETLAFPGAEGFAAFVTGGRGGEVVYVTNLNDSGEGSFRWACEKSTPSGKKTIMFKIGGTITLKSAVSLTQNNVTIAGQSAPGGGICLRDYQFEIRGYNIIVRHMRFRSGEVTNKEQMSVKLSACHDVILDHCSATWALDECLTSNSIYNISIQNCIVGEGLYNSTHPKGQHSMGSLLNSKGGVSIIHSMYTTNNNRNPRAYNMLLDMRNNVVYNWGGLAYTSEYCAMVNMVDNYLLPGPVTGSGSSKIFFKVGNLQTRIYIKGNTVIERSNNTINTTYNNDNSKGVAVSLWNDTGYGDWVYASGVTDADILDMVIVDQPYPAPKLQNWKDPKANPSHPTSDLFEFVMANVGATLPKRDAADERIVNNARERKGSLVDMVMPTANKNSLTGWPVLEAGTAPVDTDGDGMPDEWEKQYGFNHNDASDGPADRDGDGYTNLEEYLNGTNPSIPEKGGDLKKTEVEALQTDALAAVVNLRAEYDAAMTELNGGLEQTVLDQITALSGKFTFSPALSTKPQQVTVSLNGVAFMKMVRISKGTYMRGMSDYEYALGALNLPDGSMTKERPQHEVTLTKDFYMAEVATTNTQFGTLMKTDASGSTPHGTTWTEATQIARILKGATGQAFQLPTEAQWEYACRAGTTTAFSFGNTITPAQANFNCTAASAFSTAGTYKSGSVNAYNLPANAWGLYGMHGNGYEYCEDLEGYKYTSTALTDPVYKPNTAGTHVLRGGSAKSTAMYCRSASRYEYKDRVSFGSRMVMMAE